MNTHLKHIHKIKWWLRVLTNKHTKMLMHALMLWTYHRIRVYWRQHRSNLSDNGVCVKHDKGNSAQQNRKSLVSYEHMGGLKNSPSRSQTKQFFGFFNDPISPLNKYWVNFNQTPMHFFFKIIFIIGIKNPLNSIQFSECGRAMPRFLKLSNWPV